MDYPTRCRRAKGLASLDGGICSMSGRILRWGGRPCPPTRIYPCRRAGTPAPPGNAARMPSKMPRVVLIEDRSPPRRGRLRLILHRDLRGRKIALEGAAGRPVGRRRGGELQAAAEGLGLAAGLGEDDLERAIAVGAVVEAATEIVWNFTSRGRAAPGDLSARGA